MYSRTSIEDRLTRARGRIDRFTPAEAKTAVEQGAVIVDTRCSADRNREGRISGAIEVPLSVLEWRCDPDSDFADDRLSDLELQIIVACNDGFSSSLAAASLKDLGFRRAADIVGGFRAWVSGGLPVTPA